MTRKLFGTDGVRGTANKPPMTAETCLKLAMATALQFQRGDHRHLVVIGKDTRLSGYMIEPALTAGFVGMGMDVTLVGPMPTPAVAMLTKSLRADLGVVISASHNPYEDNGVKFFGPDGYKLSDDMEAAIEARMKQGFDKDLAPAGDLGRARRLDDAPGRYVEYVKSTFPRGLRLDGLKIVIDCANGAAYKVAPTVLWELGAEVVPIGVHPNGCNINKEVGATATEALQSQVVVHGADIGIALDGDADRVIIVDEKGRRIDGDQIMALVAKSWADNGILKGQGLVATVMSNLGLERYLNDQGLSLIRTPVGDRYVVEQMKSGDYNLGGEQSGHIVLSDYGTTGDGLVAALQVLAVLIREQKPASELLQVFEPCPQKLKNVRFGDGVPLEDPRVKQTIKDCESRLGNVGRILVRKSGTEPVIRIMAEGDDSALIDTVIGEIEMAICAVS